VRRSLMMVLAVALAALVFAPAAFAQDDNPTADDVVASPTASATGGATDDSGTDTTALPTTGGAPMLSLLGAVAGVLLVGFGIVAAILLGRRNS
jgi:hypothetical protein